MKYKKGLILGKFMPPHKGHEYLFRFGKEYCENLTIVVDCLKEQTISPELRKKWIEELITGVEVIALKDFMPQSPSEIENFWDIWKNALYNASGKPDVLIAAMDYGYELARVLECDFIPLDIARQSVPISATEIRNNPLKNWNYIVESARGYYLKKICLIGPESTGKSTISENLAKKFNTVYVPEYAKAIIEKQDGKIYEKNMKEFAYAQIRTEKALERMTNKVMLCDSDIITTIVYGEELYGKVDKELYDIAKEQKYEHTFLMYPDTPWKNDIHRNIIDNSFEYRIHIFNKMKQKLIENDRGFTILKGSFEKKEEFIKNYINTLVNEP